MMKRLKYIWICLLLMSIGVSYAQNGKIIQFSGLITSPGSDLPVPYVTITNASFKNQMFMSNDDGYFSFVAHVGDSIKFSSVGYHSVSFLIPDVPDDRFTAHIQMRSRVTELPVVTPYPWASYEDYINDFMAMGNGVDPVATARRNLSPEAMAALARLVPRNADEIQNYNSLQRHNYMQNKNINQRMNNPFLNPFNWAQFIKQIQRGDYSREKLKY